jgi:hypothetical protein
MIDARMILLATLGAVAGTTVGAALFLLLEVVLAGGPPL